MNNIIQAIKSIRIYNKFNFKNVVLPQNSQAVSEAYQV